MVKHALLCTMHIFFQRFGLQNRIENANANKIASNEKDKPLSRCIYFHLSLKKTFRSEANLRKLDLTKSFSVIKVLQIQMFCQDLYYSASQNDQTSC